MTADGKKPHSFFDYLKAKISKQPDRRFDQVFWSKFEHEFGTSPFAPKPSAFDRLLGWIRPVRYLIAAGGVSALAVALYIKAPWRDPSMQPADLAELEASGPVIASLSQVQGMLDNLELFETLDDVELSDQEWNELLKGENVG